MATCTRTSTPASSSGRARCSSKKRALVLPIDVRPFLPVLAGGVLTAPLAPRLPPLFDLDGECIFNWKFLEVNEREVIITSTSSRSSELSTAPPRIQGKDVASSRSTSKQNHSRIDVHNLYTYTGRYHRPTARHRGLPYTTSLLWHSDCTRSIAARAAWSTQWRNVMLSSGHVPLRPPTCSAHDRAGASQSSLPQSGA